MKRLILFFTLTIMFLSSALMLTNQTTAYADTSTIPKISGGGNHSIALKNDGTVWMWGANTYGELGDGTNTDKHSPAQILGISGVKDIAAGYNHTLILKDDGTVWACGRNLYGQLGDGTNVDKNIPTQVVGLSGIINVFAGSYHSIALKNDGTVWVWGYNNNGQLGDGTTSNKNTPIQLASLTDIKAISGGAYYTIAVKSDGTVSSWGLNSFGELGDGTTTNKSIPVQLATLDSISKVACGGHHSFALKDDGNLYSWGYNNKGQLGDGTTTDRTSPVQVTGISYLNNITAGDSFSLCVKNDNTVWAWGYNGYGSLGDGTNSNTNTPVQIPNFNNNISISAGISGYHVLCLKNDGTVWAWGLNDRGQVGDGSTTNRNSPVQVIGLNLGSTISLNAPMNLTATAGNTQVSLSWTAVEGVTSCNVKRSTTAGGPYTTVASNVYDANYTDTAVTNGTTYYYVVTAVNADGESANSNEASATPIAPVASGKALLVITMSNGLEKEYEMTMTEVNSFINWYNSKAASSPTYIVNKTFNKGPFTSRKDYIVFDKILTFEVNEYEK